MIAAMKFIGNTFSAVATVALFSFMVMGFVLIKIGEAVFPAKKVGVI